MSNEAVSGADQDEPLGSGSPAEPDQPRTSRSEANPVHGRAPQPPGPDTVWWRSPAAPYAVPGPRPPITRPLGTPAALPRVRRHDDARRPVVGFLAVIMLGFIGLFFAWFSAAPFWLSVGHAHHGTATVANCPVAGLDRRCATFVAAGHAYTAQVTLLGPNGSRAHVGATIAAEMVSQGDSIAYAGDHASLYLRWIPGVVIVVLCALGIARATGATRVTRRRPLTLALAVAAPLLFATAVIAVPVL